MNSAAINAANARHQMNPCPSVSPTAHAEPTSTGTTAAGSVRGRAPATHWLNVATRSGPPRKRREVGLALRLVRLAPFLGLIRGVEEEVGVVRQLLDAREPVFVRMEA